MMEEEQKPLIIPENCPPLKYIVNGFTQNDVEQLVLIGVISLILAVAAYFKTRNTIISVMIVLFIVAAAVTIWHRDIYTENMIDKIRILRRYKKSQKHFIYIYYDEIKKIMEKVGKENEK